MNKFDFLNDEIKAQIFIKRAKSRIIQFYNSESYQNFISKIKSKPLLSLSNDTSNFISNTTPLNLSHSIIQHLPSSSES